MIRRNWVLLGNKVYIIFDECDSDSDVGDDNIA